MTQSTLQSQFLESVVSLNPKIATFDCDGTLWSVDAGEGFFSWELEEKLVPDEIVRWARQRYANYKAGEVAEDVMCGEMVTMHRGLREEIVQQACDTFFAKSAAPHIFPEMQELVARLQQNGCDVWAVSSSNEWVIRAGMKPFGIAEDHILATKVEVENGLITDRLACIPSGPGKPKVLRKVVKKEIDAAFGNSRWDADMLAIAKHAFAVNPNPDLEVAARQRGWTIYFPDGTRH